MKITISEHAGFCPGVRHADKTVRDLIKQPSRGRIFTIGKLIHNRLEFMCLRHINSNLFHRTIDILIQIVYSIHIHKTKWRNSYDYQKRQYISPSG